MEGHVESLLMTEESKGEGKAWRVGGGFSDTIQIGEAQGKEMNISCSKPDIVSSIIKNTYEKHLPGSFIRVVLVCGLNCL